MRAAIYTRVSHHRQVEEGSGLETQEKRCRAYAEMQGWEVVKVYTDKGVSGGKESRPGLDAMRANIGDLDRVICFKLSRLGRSARDVLNRIAEFQAQGVEVVFVEDGLDTSKAAHKLVITILAGVAEMEAENNREHAMAGMEEAAARGVWQGGMAPYGFTVNEETGKLELDPEDSETVKTMVDLILSGNSTAEVADTLNASGNKPPRGNKWKSAEVRRSLRREALIGKLEWSGIAIEAPAIIGRDTYKDLIRVLDQTSLTRTKSDEWPLSERTMCTCGGYLIAAGRRHGNRYYRCNNHQGDRKGECGCDHDLYPDRPRWWRADELDWDAWNMFTVLLQDRGAIETAMDQHLGTAQGAFDEDLYRKVAKNVKTQQAALVSAEADRYGAEDPELHEQIITTIKGRLEDAQSELDRLELARTNRDKAAELREAWITAVDEYTSEIAAPPSLEEMEQIFTRLNVSFNINGEARESSHDSPGAWISCAGFVVAANESARPSARDSHGTLRVGMAA